MKSVTDLLTFISVLTNTEKLTRNLSLIKMTKCTTIWGVPKIRFRRAFK